MSDDSPNYNYGVLKGGIYKTRHEAVGAAAILNRDKPIDIHVVHVLPNVLGAAELLQRGFSRTLSRAIRLTGGTQ